MRNTGGHRQTHQNLTHDPFARFSADDTLELMGQGVISHRTIVQMNGGGQAVRNTFN